jgi:hypothetical protein
MGDFLGKQMYSFLGKWGDLKRQFTQLTPHGERSRTTIAGTPSFAEKLPFLAGFLGFTSAQFP